MKTVKNILWGLLGLVLALIAAAGTFMIVFGVITVIRLITGA